MIRIIVVDDHAIVRSGLCQLLKTQSDFEVVGDAGAGRDGVELVNHFKPDVLLLDMDLPDIDGIEVTLQTQASSPDTAVLILTMYESEEIANRAMRSGALGYLIKGTDPAELPMAVRAVAQGKPYVTPTIRDQMLLQRYKGDREDNPLTYLSKREFQILVELSKGLSLTELAEKLCISKSTVKTYKNRLHEKLGIDNISHIVKFCMRHGLIDKY